MPLVPLSSFLLFCPAYAFSTDRINHLFILLSLTLIAVLVVAVPVMAAGDSAPTDPGQITRLNKAKILVRLLLVQDEAKVYAFIDRAADTGKLTSEQAANVKEFWDSHHRQFTRFSVLIRLLRADNGARVQNYVDNAVARGRISQVQADKIIQIWEILHTSPSD